MSEHSSLTRSVGAVSAFTLLSRVTGLARDMVFAGLFGAGLASDAFTCAFTIPNVLRRFFAEGALSIAFVPVFSDHQAKHTREETARLYDVTLGWFSAALLVVVGLGVLGSPLLVKLFAPGFGPDKFELAVFLNRIMFPYLALVGVTSLMTAILNTHRHFAAPAAAPILLNLAQVGCALGLAWALDPPITAMAVGVLVGGLLQLALQIPFLLRRGIRLRPRLSRGEPAVRRMLTLMAPAAFGLAVYQVNILVSRALASLISEGAMTHIYYSDRFLELPLGVFAVAVATVALPSLASQAALGELEKLKDTLRYAWRLTLFVCVPAMVWMAVCRVPMISTLLQRGHFTWADTQLTSEVFLAASAGLWAIAAIRNTVPAFYALHDTKTPVYVALAAFVLNAGLGAALMFPLGAAGLTAANSVSAIFNLAALLVLLRRRVGPLGLGPVGRTLGKVLAASLAAGVACWPVTRLEVWSAEGALGAKALWLSAAAAGGAAVFLAVAWALRVEELRALVQRFRRRPPQPPPPSPDALP
ncbi:MAG TPA: murein biosynthesis integral membrane protein MurJ [Myxococcota bacterium]|nr:murein biosynthesis integral membrane protein MurJ [Myxococcota bacterium]HRY94308.1 murein biosynthesis integral membrane protein MurJ [Myxococcota bacterium]